MERDYIVRDVGEGREDVTVVEWFVGVGDSVEVNQPLCSVETAKSTVELPSPFAGVLLVCAVRPGNAYASATCSPVSTSMLATPWLASLGQGRLLTKNRRWSVMASSPGAPTAARADGRRVTAEPEYQQVEHSEAVDHRVSGLLGTSPTDRGMEAVTDSLPGSSKDMTHTDSVATRASAPERRGHDHTDDVREIPIEGVRARIAEHMVLARSTIPEATCAIWADCERLIKLRKVLTSAYLPTPAVGS